MAAHDDVAHPQIFAALTSQIPILTPELQPKLQQFIDSWLKVHHGSRATQGFDDSTLVGPLNDVLSENCDPSGAAGNISGRPLLPSAPLPATSDAPLSSPVSVPSVSSHLTRIPGVYDRSLPASSPATISFAHADVIAAPCALILLNTEVEGATFLKQVWKQCSAFRILADGASSRLYSVLSEAEREEYLPHAIAGDMDSASPEVLRWYEAKGVHVGKDPDQDTNDLQKCLGIVKARQAASGERWRVIIFGGFGGRFDQEMQNINALYSWDGMFKQLTLLSCTCYASLLPAGRSLVVCAPPFEARTCGLIPLSGSTKITTRGLKWDVEDWSSEFGGLISTSNRLRWYDDEKSRAGAHEPELYAVEVFVTRPVIWTSTIEGISSRAPVSFHNVMVEAPDS